MVNVVQDFKIFLYNNEFDIKNRLYDRYLDNFNKKELDYLHKILVKMYISKTKMNPFSDEYCSLCSEETKMNVVLPFLEKEDNFLRYDVINIISINSLEYHNLAWCLKVRDIDLKKFIFKLCKHGGYVKTQMFLSDDNTYRLDIIKYGKRFFRLSDYECHICTLKFYKQPWGIKDYTRVLKDEVSNFLIENGLNS